MILHMQPHVMLWEPFIRPSLKDMSTLIIKPIKGYEETASISYLDTWLWKPDCLCLPYTYLPQLQFLKYYM